MTLSVPIQHVAVYSIIVGFLFGVGWQLAAWLARRYMK